MIAELARFRQWARGLDVRGETVEDSHVIEGLEMDIVSHDVRKFFGLLLKK